MSVDAQVQYATDVANIPDPEQIQHWLEAALIRRKEHAELVVRIVDKEESAQLNQQYRGKQGATNVLSFPFEAPEGIPELSALSLLGDLVICAPVVEAQAKEQNKDLTAHWAHMVVHGCLHLLGYDHQSSAEAEEMEALEAGILKEMGFPHPYENG